MIKIIKEPSKEFIMICSKCNCKFSYELEDLKQSISAYYLHCPHCNQELFHHNRQKEMYE